MTWENDIIQEVAPRDYRLTMLEVMDTVSYYQSQPPTTVRVVGMEAGGKIECDLYDVDHAVSLYSINRNPYHPQHHTFGVGLISN